MAIAIPRKRAPFTYIWTIENFSQLTYVHLKSPPFYARSVSKVEWHICIEEIIELCCWIRSEDKRKESPADIYFEYSFLDADGSPFKSKRTDKYTFFSFMLTREEFFERRFEFAPNNTLTLQLQMWKRTCEIQTTDFCYARTKLKTYTGSFLWPVSEFSALKSNDAEDSSNLALDERKVYSLKPYIPEKHLVVLVLYVKRNDESEDVCIDFVIEKNRDYGYCCEISVLDANGDVIEIGVDRNRGHFRKTVLNFPKIISKSKLAASKNLLLRKDTLLLRCSFEIYAGINSSEIEYCTPYVSSLIKGKEDVLVKETDPEEPFQFEGYHIPELEENYLEDNCIEEKGDPGSCNKSCLLKAALICLQSEALLSDITLKIGERLFSIHRNILGSRSPIFERRFNNVAKDSTIEINDMDENTLCRLLLYVYTDAVRDLPFEDALDLYKVSADYELFDLQDKCSDILIVQLSKNNVSEVLSLANKFEEKKLQTAVRVINFCEYIKIDFLSGAGKAVEENDRIHFASGSEKDIKKDENSKSFAEFNLI